MDVPFIKQVCLELIKGGFILIGLAVGGWYASRALERFKRNQDVLADVRKRQYQALMVLLEALGKFEYQARLISFDCAIAYGDRQVNNAMRSEWDGRLLKHMQEVESATITQSYFVGGEVAKLVRDFVSEVMDQTRDHFGKPMDEEQAKKDLARLNELRRPLQILLPSFQSLS